MRSRPPTIFRQNLATTSAFLVLCLQAFVFLSAQTTRPDTSRHDRIAKWFAQLSEPDPAARDRARYELMGLTRDDLPVLRSIVEASRPLLPSQAVVLRDIVTQVHLSGEPYPANRDAGFLGVRMHATAVSVSSKEDDARSEPAVVILERLPGFCGFRALQEGDVLLAINSDPPLRIRQPNDLSAAIQGFSAGETIELAILRQGRTLTVRLILDAYPQVVPPELDAFLFRRNQAARDYWNKTFAPLIEEKLSRGQPEGEDAA